MFIFSCKCRGIPRDQGEEAFLDERYSDSHYSLIDYGWDKVVLVYKLGSDGKAYAIAIGLWGCPNFGDECQSLRSCLGWSWLREGQAHALGHQHVHCGLVHQDVRFPRSWLQRPAGHLVCQGPPLDCLPARYCHHSPTGRSSLGTSRVSISLRN